MAAGHTFETSIEIRKIGKNCRHARPVGRGRVVQLFPFRRPRRLGVTLNTLLGRKGSLEKMKDYWDVGFYLGANILANEHRKVIDACEKLYKLKAPKW